MLTYVAFAWELELPWGLCRPPWIYRNKELHLNGINQRRSNKNKAIIFVSNRLVSDTMMFLWVQVGLHRFWGCLGFVANAIILQNLKLLKCCIFPGINSADN